MEYSRPETRQDVYFLSLALVYFVFRFWSKYIGFNVKIQGKHCWKVVPRRPFYIQSLHHTVFPFEFYLVLRSLFHLCKGYLFSQIVISSLQRVVFILKLKDRYQSLKKFAKILSILFAGKFSIFES
jgi:hypothetical protein